MTHASLLAVDEIDTFITTVTVASGQVDHSKINCLSKVHLKQAKCQQTTVITQKSFASNHYMHTADTALMQMSYYILSM